MGHWCWRQKNGSAEGRKRRGRTWTDATSRGETPPRKSDTLKRLLDLNSLLARQLVMYVEYRPARMSASIRSWIACLRVATQLRVVQNKSNGLIDCDHFEWAAQNAIVVAWVYLAVVIHKIDWFGPWCMMSPTILSATQWIVQTSAFGSCMICCRRDINILTTGHLVASNINTMHHLEKFDLC
jgi:hypothetical protein